MKSQRTFFTACLIASFVLITSGLTLNLVARQLDRPNRVGSIKPGTLKKLPLRIGQWIGREAPLDPRIVKATGSDDLLNRVYRLSGQGDSVGLFISYGSRARDLLPHRPEVCYPGAGWTLRQTLPAAIPLSGNDTLEGKVYHFERGGLDARSLWVLNYFIIDGRWCPDAALLKSRAWRGEGAIRYMVQVQIVWSATFPTLVYNSDFPISAFAAESARQIRTLLPDAENCKQP